MKSKSKTKPLTFAHLREQNVKRCEDVFFGILSWSPTDWGCALAGEVGEACNELKKALRARTAGPRGTRTALTNADYRKIDRHYRAAVIELADVIIYADLLAARLKLTLEEAVIAKFNEVSIKKKSKLRL